MKTIDESRKAIDEIDQELVRLFEERFHVVEDVVAYKKANNLPIYDASREEKIIQKNKALIEDERLLSYFEDWYQKLLEVSKQFQEDQK